MKYEHQYIKGKKETHVILGQNQKDFNLDHIFDCGQCFRWEKEEDGSYTGIALGKIANFTIKDDKLIIKNTEEEDFENIWYDYLDMETDYGKIKAKLIANDDKGIMREAVKTGEGIRILKQDPWETLISFIISQNNNIPRIKKNISELNRTYGKKAGVYNSKEYYNMAEACELAYLTEDEIKPLKLGYRSKFILDTANKVEKEGKIRLDVGTYMGVGPKVESCIRLFGFHDMASFPIDVWVKRVMNRLYGFDERDVKGMADFACENFGEYAGIAQQYLFYYVRTKDGKQK